uniref:Uncharacterized protein n=1 Tax=Manihot esculenta TaxID=3983 RepID=A0A2C9VSD8_MANES
MECPNRGITFFFWARGPTFQGIISLGDYQPGNRWVIQTWIKIEGNKEAIRREKTRIWRMNCFETVSGSLRFEAKENRRDISTSIIACIADLAFKYAGKISG